jgi:hypothetical protein
LKSCRGAARLAGASISLRMGRGCLEADAGWRTRCRLDDLCGGTLCAALCRGWVRSAGFEAISLLHRRNCAGVGAGGYACLCGEGWADVLPQRRGRGMHSDLTTLRSSAASAVRCRRIRDYRMPIFKRKKPPDLVSGGGAAERLRSGQFLPASSMSALGNADPTFITLKRQVTLGALSCAVMRVHCAPERGHPKGMRSYAVRQGFHPGGGRWD